MGRIQYVGIKVMILVTGASGFIGRHVIADLLRRSIKVRVACRQEAGFKPSIDNLEVIYLELTFGLEVQNALRC